MRKEFPQMDTVCKEFSIIIYYQDLQFACSPVLSSFVIDYTRLYIFYFLP